MQVCSLVLTRVYAPLSFALDSTREMHLICELYSQKNGQGYWQLKLLDQLALACVQTAGLANQVGENPLPFGCARPPLQHTTGKVP